MSDRKARYNHPGADANLPQHIEGAYGGSIDPEAQRTGLATGEATAAAHDVADPHPTIPEPRGQHGGSGEPGIGPNPARHDGSSGKRPADRKGARG